jgi:hypothetical protein
VLGVRSTPAPSGPVEPDFAASYAIADLPNIDRATLLAGGATALQQRFSDLDATAAQRVLDWARNKYGIAGIEAA